MKLDVLVARRPAIVFGFMGVQIVQDDVQLAVRMLGDKTVHDLYNWVLVASSAMLILTSAHRDYFYARDHAEPSGSASAIDQTGG